MKKKQTIDRLDGGPVFPALPLGSGEPNSGNLSMRDYFAAHVLGGIFSGGAHIRIAKTIAEDVHASCMSSTEIGAEAERRIAAMCYATADAMLAERAK